MTSLSAILTESITIRAPVLGVSLLAVAKDFSVFPRIIVQILVWLILPCILGVLAALAYRRARKKLPAMPRRSTQSYTDVGARFTGLSYVCIAVLVGLANLYLTHFARFTHEEVAKASDWVWITLAVGAMASLTAVGYVAWFYGTRIVWPSKDRRPVLKRRDRALVPYADDSPDAPDR